MGLRAAIERLPPYPSLLLLVPWLLIEGIKLVALVFVGEGHWLGGVIFYIFAYGAGALSTERLFAIVRPKLLRLQWFARLWGYVSRIFTTVRSIKVLASQLYRELIGRLWRGSLERLGRRWVHLYR